jgi:nucleoside-diphosphate-sugar epimerase
VAVEETFFITGFPGFIATRLLKRLATQGGRFLLLVQPAFAARAREELSAIARETGLPPNNFRIVEGDISQPSLNLSPDDLNLACAGTTVIFHLAAVYDLAVSRDLAMRVNVEGTRNVNAFARACRNLGHYHYVSTCYVAGKRQDRILETDLRHEAGFRNYYEESKYLAEVEVDSLKRELPVTIHRPAVVCGDSQTGETAKYDGVYYLIHYLLKSPRLLTRFNIGNSQVSLNLIPVDFVVAAFAALAQDPSAVGKTLQIADPDPPTTEELFDIIARSMVGKSSSVTVFGRLVERFLMLPLSPRITGLPHYGVPYFFLKQTYDTSQSSSLLARHNIRCPAFKSYAAAIVEFAESHPTL